MPHRTNVLTVLAGVYAVNGLLTWIGRGFGIHALTIQLVLGYIFYPVSFFMGVPTGEILRVSQLLGTKLVANEFVAYTGLCHSIIVFLLELIHVKDLHGIMTSSEPLSERAFVVASYALCGFANLGTSNLRNLQQSILMSVRRFARYSDWCIERPRTISCEDHRSYRPFRHDLRFRTSPILQLCLLHAH